MFAGLLASILIATAGTVAADTRHHEFAQWHHRSSDHDLFTFVTRPDLKATRLKVAFHKEERTPPGYLFVAPYDCLECSSVPATAHVTHQIGPHIYTQDGELVWSGADQFPATRVFDFRPVLIDGAHHLSLVAPVDAGWQSFPNGTAMVLDASYRPIFSLDSSELGDRLDFLDFNVLGEGHTAMITMTESRRITESDGVPWNGEIVDCLFTEIDLRTRERLFTWTASEHIPLAESSNPVPSPDEPNKQWDWFHLNSVDKDSFGNYIVSARFTNTIYYVAPDGSIIWRLGGPNSSFEQNFNFSRQGHARVRDQNEVNMVISFFDNAADDTGHWEPTSASSSLNVVGLDLENMKADLYHRHERPDGGLTATNGNIDFLPNGGVFGGWGENGYMTEYVNRGGEKLYEASFASQRFSNHRAYKSEFIAQPLTKPDVKASVSTNSRGQLRTALYVSWNGATEVSTWRFYSHGTKRGLAVNDQIGLTPKAGFETSFMATGYHPVIFAEALDAFGNSLANSSLEVTEIPPGFHSAQDPIYVGTPGPLSWDGLGLRPEKNVVMSMSVAFIAGLCVASIGWLFRFLDRSRRWTSKRKRQL